MDVIEVIDTLFGFTRRFRPRSESAPGPLELGVRSTKRLAAV